MMKIHTKNKIRILNFQKENEVCFDIDSNLQKENKGTQYINDDNTAGSSTQISFPNETDTCNANDSSGIAIDKVENNDHQSGSSNIQIHCFEVENDQDIKNQGVSKLVRFERANV